MKDKTFQIGQGFLLITTLWLHLANLGYSDYQGDEIKALAAPLPGQSLLGFLLEQRKGPVEFVISYLIRLWQPSLENRFLTRLPFALASIAAVYFFYRLVELHTHRKAALTSSLFLGVNGLLIGLTRIVQYQSFVILFCILTLYCFTLALKVPGWKITGLCAGIFFWVVALLSHFDAVFIAPMAAYLLVSWFRQNKGANFRRWYPYLALSIGLAALVLAAFYVPYFLSLRESTQEYWLGRILGDELKTGIPSSLFTFKLYNPLLAIYVYIALSALSLLRLPQSYPIWLWLAFPWIVLELVFADPGTHIYTYLLPACILLALGVEALEEVLRRFIGEKIGQTSIFALVGVTLVFLAAVSHLIFVDNTPEYPWEQRRILFWTIGVPDTRYSLWLFGFPYNRQWAEISEYVQTSGSSDYYCTNENKTISSNWVSFPFDVNRSGYYIHILYPQSLRDKLADDKIRYWTKNYPPVMSYTINHKVVAEIYIMPPGNVEELKSQGY